LGFKLGLKIRIGQPAPIEIMSDDVLRCDVVYVAIFADQRKPLIKGDALRVGQTKRNLLHRWNGIAATFSRDNLRKNEVSDRSKWLKVANGKWVSVWVKQARKIKIPYAPDGLKTYRFSARCAEEEFLDRYYEPRLGIKLNREEMKTPAV
jgi:hypothetical protein